ncbi:hypothetical protein DTO271D3_8357 [Paecilomyces variotii]|nr:hypothetical protein DTO271D3_8357 [Paecilomyces variotii]
MLNQESDNAQPLEDGTELEKLDAEGDVVLVVGGNSMRPRQFLVSSKVLSLASPVFARLFGPQFLEGSQMARHGSITVHLDEDDAKGMGIMLGILHYQERPEIEGLSAKEMATLAICCDKYDCARVIRPWISNWFRMSRFVSAKDHGFGLLAAHLLRASDKFSSITWSVQMKFGLSSFDEWDDEEILNLLPRSLRRDLTKAIGVLLSRIHNELQSMEFVLRGTVPVKKSEMKMQETDRAPKITE